MSKQLTPEAVSKAAKDVGIDEAKRLELLQILADMQAAEEDEPEKEPAVKKQFVILVSKDSLQTSGAAPIGWVLQIPETVNPATLVERVHAAAAHFNMSKKGRANPAQTIGDAMQCVKPKIAKEYGLTIKTKEPVYVFVEANEIPEAPSVLKSADEIGGES